MSIFRNSHGKIRVLWQILLFFLLYTLLSLISSILLRILYYGLNLSSDSSISLLLINIFKDKNYSMVIYHVIDLFSCILAIFIIIKKFYKKNLRDIGMVPLKNHCSELIFGLIFGAISMSVIFFILLFTENITIEKGLSSPSISYYTYTGIAVFIAVGIKEELLCRGYLMNLLNDMNRPWLSIILSSVIFSLLHIFNPNVEPLGLLNIILVGILFGYMYLRSRNLWMPIGYHITWNYFQGNVFGFPVSGTDPQGIYSICNIKDNLLTGGKFGPEGGILATAVILISFFVIYKLPLSKAKNSNKLERY